MIISRKVLNMELAYCRLQINGRFARCAFQVKQNKVCYRQPSTLKSKEIWTRNLSCF